MFCLLPQNCATLRYDWKRRFADKENKYEHNERAVADSQQEVVLQLGGLSEGLTTLCIEMRAQNGISHKIPVLMGVYQRINKTTGFIPCGKFGIDFFFHGIECED